MMWIELLSAASTWFGDAIKSDTGKIVVGAAGALFIAWFNTRLGIWRDERGDKRNREGQLAYSTALLVSALRQYMLNCMVVMNDDGQPDRDQGKYQDWITTVQEPKFSYSDKIDWTLFDQQLMFEVLSLSTVEADQEECVSSAYDHSFGPDRLGWIEERQLRYAELGAIAASHLTEIHKKHPMKFTGEPLGSIREITHKLIALEEARKKDQAEHAAHLAAWQKVHPPSPPASAVTAKEE